MQIVTDSGVDLGLAPGQLAELNIHVVPLVVTRGFCGDLPTAGG